MTAFYRMATIMMLPSLALGSQCCAIVDTDIASLTSVVLWNQQLAIVMPDGRNITGSTIKPTDLWTYA